MSLIYYLIFFLIVIGAIKEYFYLEKGSRLYYYFIVTIMIFTAGLGFNLSPDWLGYFTAYKEVNFIDWDGLSDYAKYYGMEAGYIYLNKVYNILNFDFGMLSLSLVIVSVSLKVSTFYKYSPLPFLALFMYAMPNFMFEEHVHIRQGLATGIALYSTRYIIDKKMIKFILCIIIAYQFHESCIIFVLAYWIARIKINIELMFWIVTFSIVANYTGMNSIIESIMSVIPFGQDKFESYQSQLYAESGLAVGDIVKIITVFSIIIYNKYAEHDELYCMFRNLLLFGIILYFFLGKGIFGIRLPGYYLSFIGLAVSRMIYNIKGDDLKQSFIFYSFIFYTSLLIFWFQYKQGHKSNFGNYKTFFVTESPYGLWKN